MALPDYPTCMLPFLRFLADGQEHSLRDTEEALARNFDLNPNERAELLPSGQQGVFKNRLGWARTYLKKAGLLASPSEASSRSLTVVCKPWPPILPESTLVTWSSFQNSWTSARPLGPPA